MTFWRFIEQVGVKLRRSVRGALSQLWKLLETVGNCWKLLETAAAQPRLKSSRRAKSILASRHMIRSSLSKIREARRLHMYVQPKNKVWRNMRWRAPGRRLRTCCETKSGIQGYWENTIFMDFMFLGGAGRPGGGASDFKAGPQVSNGL